MTEQRNARLSFKLLHNMSGWGIREGYFELVMTEIPT